MNMVAWIDLFIKAYIEMETMNGLVYGQSMFLIRSEVMIYIY